jgi:hypothetical protein
MKKLFALLFLSLAACGVEMVDEVEDVQEPTPAFMQSYAAPATLELGELRPTVNCDPVYLCERCQTNRNRNYIVEFCDDGTRQRVYTGPCGEPCL